MVGRCTILLAVGGLFLAGCAGYRLGPTAGQVAGEKSVRIPFASNKTLEPRLVQPVTQALRRQMQQDGTFRLETRSGAVDLTLETTIEKYERIPMTYQRTDVITASEYELRMTGRVVLLERGQEEPLIDRRVLARTSMLAGPDQTSAERQAAPLLADDFARKAVLLVVEGSW